jgi:hypothetical protein
MRKFRLRTKGVRPAIPGAIETFGQPYQPGGMLYTH